MKKKLLSLPFIATGIILIAIGILMAGRFIDKQSEEKAVLSEKEASEYIDKITETVVHGGTREELLKILYMDDDQLIDSDIMSGPDMYLRQIPDKKIIKDEDISRYQEVADSLASNLEKKIQENLEYNIEGISDGGDYWGVLVNYRSYYYHAYLHDLAQIQSYLISLSGYQTDGSGGEVSDEFQLASYKARIKAASILDSHLDDYVNTGETNQTYVNFNGKKAKNSSKDFMSYFMNLAGYSYQFQGNIQTNNQVQQYLTDVTIDSNNPLAL